MLVKAMPNSTSSGNRAGKRSRRPLLFHVAKGQAQQNTLHALAHRHADQCAGSVRAPLHAHDRLSVHSEGVQWRRAVASQLAGVPDLQCSVRSACAGASSKQAGCDISSSCGRGKHRGASEHAKSNAGPYLWQCSGPATRTNQPCADHAHHAPAVTHKRNRFMF